MTWTDWKGGSCLWIPFTFALTLPSVLAVDGGIHNCVFHVSGSSLSHNFSPFSYLETVH